MSDFARNREGYKYEFAGIKLNSQPNNLPPSKFPFASNIRTLGGGSVRVRPGQSLRFSTGGSPITDLRAYSTLSTDNKPRILARDSSDAIWLDNSAQVGSISLGGLGASFIPFRPNQSPQSWMYIANSADYQKFSAPSASNSVTQRKVGIAEPQSSPDACPDQFNVSTFQQAAAGWTAATTGAPTDITRSTDTAVLFVADPASVPPSLSTRYSMQVGNVQYQIGEVLQVNNSGGGTVGMVVQDVLPAISTQATITILSIVYYSGSTGRCVIVPSQMPLDDSVPQFQGNEPVGTFVNSESLLSTLRRGSLIQINPGGGSQETVLVLSVTQGPQGLIAIECSTTSTHVAGEVLKGLPALTVSFTQPPANLTGQSINSNAANSNTIQTVMGAAGTGTLTETISPAQNPFIIHPFVSNPTALPSAQQDDYVHVSINVSDITKLTSIRIAFDVNNGAADFVTNMYYFDILPNDLAGAVALTQTQLAGAQLAAQRTIIRQTLEPAPFAPPELSRLPVDNLDVIAPIDSGSAGTETALGASAWSEIMFPVRALTRIGNDETRTLANTQACQVTIVSTAAITVQFSSMWVSAGGQPDVGDAGALYLYRVRPRDSRTGVVGNPAPATRYGVSPRRQNVILSLPSAAYDPQIDTWDIFRWGGSVTSWRYIGSAPSSSTTFTDAVFDDAAQAGDPLDFDNFEPWPSVDLQFNGTASTVNGTLALVTIPASAGVTPLQWLPGTLVLVGGNLAYTLRLRPVLTSGTTYRLEFVECAPVGTNLTMSIPEPSLARQPQARLFGPDANGRVLAVGDALRPGTLSYSKPNNPDSAPDSYNREITSPSEPLIGGEIIDGRGWVASPERWWELIPQQSDDPTQFYNPVQSPIPRGLAAPFGHCNDGSALYWWAKDGIYSTSAGSLTDADLYNLFPHEGVVGVAVTYAGFTINPPDYSRSGTFRLAHSNGFLYATYQDSGGVYRVLTCDLKHGNAWVPDVYTPAVCAFYHPEQQPGTVLTSGTLYDETLIGTVDGRVAAQAANTNDLGGAIPCVACTFEWDGGDARAPVQWGDYFVDVNPSAAGGVVFQPASNSALIGTPQTVASSPSRQRLPLTVGGILISDYMGLVATWTENFTLQSSPTSLNLWQPSFDLQPARAIAWQTFGTSYGISGFGHIPWMEIAYVSTAPLTITITCTDGTSPAPITLPSTAGLYSRVLVRPTFNKGRLYAFAATSTAQFQIFEDDSIVMWGAWGRTGPYEMKKSLGVPEVADAVV